MARPNHAWAALALGSIFVVYGCSLIFSARHSDYNPFIQMLFRLHTVIPRMGMLADDRRWKMVNGAGLLTAGLAFIVAGVFGLI
jgi:hypothetical protein